MREIKFMEYGEDYFRYQSTIGEFGGKVNLFKFMPYLKLEDIVLDFGCGGGYLLDYLNVRQKAGLEINDLARAEGLKGGLTIYRSIEEIPDEFATVIISNHVLEHIECPIDTLRMLLPKLKPEGKAVFVVPHQTPSESYHDRDLNQHLYTWNPLTLGNLFKAAGYINIRVDVIRHKWPPNYHRLYKILGQKGFDSLCHLYALYKRNYQIRAVAHRPTH